MTVSATQTSEHSVAKDRIPSVKHEHYVRFGLTTANRGYQYFTHPFDFLQIDSTVDIDETVGQKGDQFDVNGVNLNVKLAMVLQATGGKSSLMIFFSRNLIAQ